MIQRLKVFVTRRQGAGVQFEMFALIATLYSAAHGPQVVTSVKVHPAHHLKNSRHAVMIFCYAFRWSHFTAFHIS